MPDELRKLYPPLPRNGTVLDIGCLDFLEVRRAHETGRGDLQQCGVDYSETPDHIPDGFVYKRVDLNVSRLPFDDDRFDLVVARHIIEHLRDPILFFGDCLRVMKPGGLLFIEAPSERSQLLPGMPFSHDSFFSLSFFDDPTHIGRPWTPQAFYRLTKYYTCIPVKVGYVTSLKRRLTFPFFLPYALLTRNGKLLEVTIWRSLGWTSYAIVKKPDHLSGNPVFTYYLPTNR